jgi:hypothetical protein
VSDPSSVTTTPAPRYTLRQLPLPARLVITVFLLSVGLGYCSAMVQLHFQHASKGSLMPGAADVVAKFSGMDYDAWRAGVRVSEPAPPAPAAAEPARAAPPAAVAPAGEPRQVRIKSIIDTRCAHCHSPGGKQAKYPLTSYDKIKEYLEVTKEDPVCQIEQLLTQPETEAFSGSGTMAHAFTTKSKDWAVAVAAKPEAELRKEREGERLAVIDWIKTPDPARRAAYEKDAFPLPPAGAARPITPTFLVGADAGRPGDPAHATAAADPPAPNPHLLARGKQLSLDSLTQTTHVHALSFSMLYALTGFAFAFSSYPGWLRGILAPLVLAAQVVDLSCWWLARLPNVGPYFALAILGTGTVVGIGLLLQIVLTLFDLYGGKGKLVLVLMFLAGTGVGAAVYGTYVTDLLSEEQKAVQQQKEREQKARERPAAANEAPKPAANAAAHAE